MKVWQFVLSLITSAIVGFFIILFVFAAVSGVADTPTSSAQGSSQSEQGTDESKESKEKKPAKLKSITVEYSGSSEDGTEINESTEGISVEGEYSDGSTKEISEGFTIKNPGVLKAGETQEFTVVYKGFEGSFSVTASENDEQFKASSQDIAFDELARNPEANKGKKIHFRGKVVQVMESDIMPHYRVSVSEDEYGIWDSSQVIYVKYIRSGSDNRILEDDIVDIWGTSTGTITYTSTMGGDITIPSMMARIMQVSQ